MEEDGMYGVSVELRARMGETTGSFSLDVTLTCLASTTKLPVST